MKSYFLQVKDIVQETSEAITIQFWHPISEQIKYKAGQFITIAIPGDNGKKIKRSYSMSSSPHTDTAVAVTVKRVQGGVVSNYLNDNVKKGDFLEVIEPMGTFNYDADLPKIDRNVVLVAAGSGITPLMSIAKSLLKTEANTKVLLIYGNRNEENIIFNSQIAQLEQDFNGRFTVNSILSNPADTWVGAKGRINQANATQWLKDWSVDFNKDHFYLCGPVPMMDEIKKICDIYDVKKEQFHIEKFNAPTLDDEPAEGQTEGLKKQTITINYDGNTYTLDVEPHQTILEAALEKDIDLPYSCQAGMCTACMGKCTTGKVKMDEDDGLTDKEIKEGYVLTCVSHPVSEGVVIEID
jgi:ring-1,2-phenylacetyl-CoA epoxidase subunit PaaE